MTSKKTPMYLIAATDHAIARQWADDHKISRWIYFKDRQSGLGLIGCRVVFTDDLIQLNRAKFHMLRELAEIYAKTHGWELYTSENTPETT